MALINNINGYQGQIIYQDFKDNLLNIETLIKENSIIGNDKTCLISRIGIQAIPGDQFELTNQSPGTGGGIVSRIKIGKTGFYEANDVEISHIKYFPKKKDTNSNENEERFGHDVIIDYIIKEGV